MPASHTVQFYDDEAFLLDTVTSFLASGLEVDGAAIVIATKAHLDAIDERLRVRRIDTLTARAKGHYVPLDAAAALSLIMDDGLPDERRFNEIIGGIVAESLKTHTSVRAFGEMVALLTADRNWKAAVRLESLWTQLGRRHSFALLCAYPLRDFGRAEYGDAFVDVCAAHSDVTPVEGYVGLRSATERLRMIAHLQQKAAALEAALAERSELLAREQAARASAEVASRTKDEFLAMLSHELRTPLNAILGWTQMLRAGDLDGAVSHRAIDVIQRNTHTLERLVRDLLDVSRIVTGRMALDVGEVDLARVIGGVVDSLRPAAESKRLTVESELEADTVPLRGDPARLEQIIWNLVENAVKFTPEGGRVSVRLTAVPDGAQIIIADTGCGIAPAFLPYVFDRFRQADGSASRQHMGLGLGLAIVRHLVELHGGAVRAESDGIGRGATFIVELPCGGRPVAVASAPETERRFDTRAGDRGALCGVRVLVIDDSVDTCELLRLVLTEHGAAAAVACSVKDALAAIDGFKPTVLVCDIAMPEADGYDLIRGVRGRSADGNGFIPALALTAYAQPDDRERILAAGFDGYVPKPVEAATLVEIVRHLAASRAARHRPELRTSCSPRT